MNKIKNLYYTLLAWFTGKNSDKMPVDVILHQLNERRPLPTGMAEFEEWANRIISGTLLPQVDDASMKFALSTMLLQLGPTEDYKEDSYFLHQLRKSAVNQIAHSKMLNLKAAAQGKLEAQKLKDEAAADAIRLAIVQDEATALAKTNTVPVVEATLARLSLVGDRPDYVARATHGVDEANQVVTREVTPSQVPSLAKSIPN